MADTLAMTVQVSPETREFIRERVEGDEEGSESEMLAECFEPMSEDRELTEWEREEVIAAQNELNADPSSGFTFEQVQDQLAAWRRERLKAG